MSYLDSEIFANVVANTPLISIDLIVKNKKEADLMVSQNDHTLER
jgi:hypothetical protein